MKTGFLVALVAVSVIPLSHAADGDLLRQNEPFNLSPEQISTLTRQAHDGSWKAANRLAYYFANYAFDKDKAVTWFTIAAEHGSYVACRNIVSLGGTFPDLKERAEFWAKQLADGKCPER